jgi:hypothetical protein
MPQNQSDFLYTPILTDAEELSRKASDVLSDLAEQYPDWTLDELIAMTDFLNQASRTDGNQRFSLIRNDFFGKAHDIKGQGTTFGYPLMTEVGSFVCEYLRHKESFTDQDILLMQDMVKLMRNILDNRLTGDGGEAGQSIRQQIGREIK